MTVAVRSTGGTVYLNEEAVHSPSTATTPNISAKFFITRILVDFFFCDVRFLFSPLLSTRSRRAPITAFGRESRIYPPQTLSVEAMPFAFFMLLDQFCYTAKAEAASFLRSSCGRPQVQTVPSTAWVAPCPVVTPSRKGLARRCLLFQCNKNYSPKTDTFFPYALILHDSHSGT